jgi:hypothetical protein
MRKRTWLGMGAGFALVASLVIGGMTGADAGGRAPLARAGHVSGIARAEARGGAARGLSPAATCTSPGGGNYQTDCNSTGNPVNETTIAYDGTTYVAGANDYNSYNGNADLGYYTSSDAKTWTDNGPLDLFAHDTYHAAGDPGLAIDANGVVYYSGIYFDYFDCTIGGLELARRNPATGTWSYYQIAANSDAQFQDKPAIMQDGKHVFVSWTQYGSCTGVGVTSPIKIAVFHTGPNSKGPSTILSVPGSTYSQGSALASDGHGGFWVTWEEYPSADATVGAIKMVHYDHRGGGFGIVHTISPAGFTDLPSPLPGFAFRDDSFPAVALVANSPRVVWASYDTGVGRTYLFSNNVVTTVSNTGGDQFFPSVAGDANGNIAISWSQTQQSNSSYDQYLSYLGSVTKVTTASSFPNNDPIFGGAFIGDYNATIATSTAHSIWTDVRGPSFAENAMVYSP